MVTPLAQLPLEAPVTTLWGVGPERLAQLERLGIRTLEDLLLHRPRRYEDRRHVLAVRDVKEKGPVTLRGRVVALGVKHFRKRTRSVFEMILDDGTARLHCRWWNLPYLEDRFSVGMDLMIHGRVVELRPTTVDHPEVEVIDDAEPGEETAASIHMERIVPIYPSTEGLTQRWLRARIWSLVRLRVPGLPEPFPDIDHDGLPSRAEAVARLHFPEAWSEVEQARDRLAFDECVGLQLAIQTRRRRLYAVAPGIPCGGDNRLMKPFLARLGFRLTESQTAVLRTVRADLGGPHPMRRLLQGDVGSGKTVVAAAAALMVIESGHDVALMAPTEILARQHHLRFAEWFEPLGVPVHLLVGDRRGTGGNDGHDGSAVRRGSGGRREPPSLTLGTHALLEPGFAPERLGLVVIDEQHKFGVSQRERLLRKGAFPHLLVMTATPIPRTLALTLYGDLDVSVIDRPPAGRGRVRTFLRGRDQLPKVWDFVRRELAAGRQAYVVFSRVEEGDAETKAVNRELGLLRAALAPHAVGMVHGRLASEEKARVMTAFRRGELGVLLATTVIEVGVDVPNATVMVIENAEQYGLAQLHQLRGRIGRGSYEGYCVLVAAKLTPEVRERLEVLERSADGFEIAEADLKLRGPGEMLGEEQSGLPSFRFTDLRSDRKLLEKARAAVAAHLDRVAEGKAGSAGPGEKRG